MTEAEYRRTLDRLFALRRFGMRPGLEVIRGLLKELGEPQSSFRSVHVTGSKGKGSVSAMTASILQAAGRRVGLFTSPHLRSYRERMQVNGREIATADVVRGVARVEAAATRLERAGSIERPPTFFEVTTAVAFDYFRRQKIDAGVIEVGLGGRLDSTNVLDAPATAITTIELEHTEFLGTTLAEIAAEKAGIFHPGAHGVVGELPAEARRVVERAAHERGVPLWHLGEQIRIHDRTLQADGQTLSVQLPHRTVEKLELPLLGNFQASNAALSVALADRFAHALGFSLRDATIRRGLLAARWRGRLERVKRRPDLYLDVAHTPESASAIALSIAEITPFEDPDQNVLLFGCLREKRAEEMLDRLSPLARTVVLVPVRSDRSASVDVLRIAALGHFPRIVLAPTAAKGLALARAATGSDGFTLATGSDYLVGELLAAIEGGAEDGPDLADPVHRGEEPAATPPVAPPPPAEKRVPAAKPPAKRRAPRAALRPRRRGTR